MTTISKVTDTQYAPLLHDLLFGAFGPFHPFYTEGAFESTVAAEDVAPEITRADVLADLAQARSDGLMQALHGEDSGSFYRSQQHPEWTQTRAAVLAQVAAARRTGELLAMSDECGCGMNPSSPQPAHWRADATGEPLQAGPEAGGSVESVRYAGPDAAPSAESDDALLAFVA